MNKKIYHLTVVLITTLLFSSTINAQHCAQASGSGVCTPTPGLTQLGFYPPDTALPCMIIGQPFDTVINFHTPPTAQGYTLNWIKILHIDNSPCGMCWRSNDSQDKVNGNATGCVRIQGITYDAPGEYNIIVYADVNVTVGIFPITLSNLNIDSVMNLKYYLRVKQAGGICVPVDTLSPGLTAHTSGTAPVPTITGSSAVCSGATTTLGLSGGNYYAYQWSTGALTSTITAGAGTYTVTVYANCASATATKTITTTTVSATATANGPTTFCTGGSVTLNAGSGFSAYSWSNGGGTSQTATYNATGNYNCTVTQNGCTGTTNTVAVTLNNNPTPTVTANGPVSFCSGGSVTLDAGAGYTTYAWSGGGTGQTKVVTAGGSYDCTVTLNGCSGTSNTATVTVGNPTPTITANGPVSFCTGGSVTLDAGAGYIAYAWSGGGTGQTKVVTAGGSYDCTVTQGSCSGTSNSITVTVSGSSLSPVITANNGLDLCQGGSTVLDVGTGYTSYAWNNSGGTNQTVTTGTGGTYTITVSQGACTGTASATVNIGNFPVTVNLTPNNPSGCTGDVITLDAGAGHNSYEWSTNQSGQNIDVSSSNTYTVTVVDNNACSATASTIVTINTLPTPSPTPAGNQTICSGSSITLDAGTGYSAYSWSNGDHTQTTSVSSAGSYSVTVTQNGCDGASANPIVVSVTSLPTPAISPAGTQNICSGQTITLDAGAGYSAYLWSNGETTQTIAVDSTGTYNVTVTQNSCPGISLNPPTVFVNVTPNATIAELGSANGYALLQASPSNATYQWLFQAQPNGVYSVEFTTTQLDTVTCGDVGEYHTVVVSQNGCVDTSDQYTVVCAGINNISSLMSFSVQPNPANDVLNVAYELNDPTFTQISVIDLTGRKVIDVTNEMQNRGPHQHMVRLNNLASGIYMLNFTTDKGHFNTKFVKQ